MHNKLLPFVVNCILALGGLLMVFTSVESTVHFTQPRQNRWKIAPDNNFVVGVGDTAYDPYVIYTVTAESEYFLLSDGHSRLANLINTVVLAPNSQRLAMQINHHLAPSEVVFMNPDGSNRHYVTIPDLISISSMVWSPDSQSLAVFGHQSGDCYDGVFRGLASCGKQAIYRIMDGNFRLEFVAEFVCDRNPPEVRPEGVVSYCFSQVDSSPFWSTAGDGLFIASGSDHANSLYWFRLDFANPDDLQMLEQLSYDPIVTTYPEGAYVFLTHAQHDMPLPIDVVETYTPTNTFRMGMGLLALAVALYFGVWRQFSLRRYSVQHRRISPKKEDGTAKEKNKKSQP